MEWIFRRWFIHQRVWDDAPINASTTITCNLWDEVQFGLWWGGESYEFKQTRYFKTLLKPGSVVFDVGANIGYYSLVAAPLVGAEGCIYAFEPASQQFKLLTENASRCCFPQIHPYKLALSDKAGEAVLHLDDRFNTGSASLRPAGSKNLADEAVICGTLDEFVEAQGLDRLDVIKIDVEGFEVAVLKGGSKTLERLRPVLLVEVKEHHQRLAGFSRQEMFDWLKARNYLPFRINSDSSLTRINEPEDGLLVVFRHALPSSEAGMEMDASTRHQMQT